MLDEDRAAWAMVPWVTVRIVASLISTLPPVLILGCADRRRTRWPRQRAAWARFVLRADRLGGGCRPVAAGLARPSALRRRVPMLLGLASARWLSRLGFVSAGGVGLGLGLRVLPGGLGLWGTLPSWPRAAGQPCWSCRNPGDSRPVAASVSVPAGRVPPNPVERPAPPPEPGRASAAPARARFDLELQAVDQARTSPGPVRPGRGRRTPPGGRACPARACPACGRARRSWRPAVVEARQAAWSAVRPSR